MPATTYSTLVAADVPVVGRPSDRDPYYGWQCETLTQLHHVMNEVCDEVDFAAVMVFPETEDGSVALCLPTPPQKGEQAPVWRTVGWAGMDGHHADSRLWVRGAEPDHESRGIIVAHAKSYATMEDFSGA